MAAWKNIKKPVALALAGAMVFTSMTCPGMSMKTNAAEKVRAFDTAEGGRSEEHTSEQADEATTPMSLLPLQTMQRRTSRLKVRCDTASRNSQRKTAEQLSYSMSAVSLI